MTAPCARDSVQPELIMIALRGRVKGEHKAEACHLIPIVAVTKSGLKPRLWVARAVEAYARLGIDHGWMFRDSRGASAKQKKYEPMLFALIQEVINNETLPEHILTKSTEVATDYGIGRSVVGEGMLLTPRTKIFRTGVSSDLQGGEVSKMQLVSRQMSEAPRRVIRTS